MSFITTNQYKLNKSQKEGWVTAGLNLSPATEARTVLNRPDLPNMCAKSGTCEKICLKGEGFNAMPTHGLARARRTAQLFDHWEPTIELIVKEIRNRAKRHPGRFAFRPNLLSDRADLARRLADALPEIQFYDYTKLGRPHLRVKPNYHLTFSYSERSSPAEALAILETGVNVAVVFTCRKGEPLPASHWGVPVLDGQKHDLRFLDPPFHIVGLPFLGSAAELASGVRGGFVQPL